MTLTAARQVADAVLYEGYLLYPYRSTSAKNQVRWQFGVLGPRGAEEAGVGEAPTMSAEVVLEVPPAGPGVAPATLDVLVRFLQVQARTVERRTADGWEAVDALLVAGTRWIPWSEAVPVEVHLADLPLAGLKDERALPVDAAAATEVEELREDGGVVGRLVRERAALTGVARLAARRGLDPRVVVLSVELENRARWDPDVVLTTSGAAGPVRGAGWTPRDVAARTSFVGTHLLVTVRGARPLSLVDAPPWAEADTASCASSRCWPVLVAEDDGRDAVLVAPIVLGDHPSIAPESAGDLFDATEIDEILTLRVLTLTAEEREAARGTDPRAAAILDRCDALTDDELARMHGGRRPTAAEQTVEQAAEQTVERWDPRHEDADPEHDVALVRGVPVSAGSRVLLRPSRSADAQDLFLAGQTAVVARVYTDLDGRTHVAVVLEDDPGADLYAATGRFTYFSPDELEPLPSRDRVAGEQP